MSRRPFQPLDFPPWATWGQRRGIIINRIGWPRGKNNRRLCKWCRTEVPPRCSSFCSTPCREAFSWVWSWGAVTAYVKHRDSHTCVRCGTTDPPKPEGGRGWNSRTDPWDVDHIVPVADGGTDDPANLRLLCIPCHTAVGYEQRANRRDAQTGQQALPLDGAA
jgi:5-methylcytosine-specific restriction endonuclease McrA